MSGLRRSKTGLRFEFTGKLGLLRRLGTVQAVYSVQQYAIPRPKALLGDENWRRFRAQIDDAIAHHNPDTFMTFTIAAAGSDSSVMSRIKQEISASTGLIESEKGDLWIRIIPGETGWETLVRLTPRPLVTRAWRICNYEAALNATVAHAMILLSVPKSEDVVVNLGCGSGTLMIERLLVERASLVIGIDNDPLALECAMQNTAARGLAYQAALVHANMTSAPLPSAFADTIFADLPFGQKVGSHRENQTLYPRVLHEAARIAKIGASFVLITHEIRLIESALAEHPFWKTENILKVTLRGLHPRLYVLRRMQD